MYYLWYDNGSGRFDCASSHDTLPGAIAAAANGWKTNQHISSDAGEREIMWSNHNPNIAERFTAGEMSVYIGASLLWWMFVIISIIR